LKNFIKTLRLVPELGNEYMNDVSNYNGGT
jgi:hypothetical protein